MTRVEILSVGLIIGIIGLFSGLAVLSAREQTRDITRLAHIREVQLGLELFFSDHSAYPVTADVTALGQTTTACLSDKGFVPPCSAGDTQSTYVEFVPSPPVQGLKQRSSCSGEGNAYCYGSEGASYHLQFELESANRLLGLEKGANCATERGFAPGACPDFASAE